MQSSVSANRRTSAASDETGPTEERRLNVRLRLPVCPRCSAASRRVILRTYSSIFVECQRCNDVRCIPNVIPRPSAL
jgi:hypothetical protein